MNNYISTYALYHPNDAYLEHSLSWGKHRYIKRTGTPGNYKYFYAEDLRNAGRNLASGARNLVSRAGNAIQKKAQNAKRKFEYSTGIGQRRDANRAAARVQVADVNASRAWEAAYYASRSNDSRRRARTGQVEQIARGLDQKRIISQHEADRAQEAYRKTKLYKIEKMLGPGGSNLKKAIAEIPSNVAYDVSHFMRSTIGIGKRSNVKYQQERLEKAKKAWRDAGVWAPSNDYERRLARELDDAFVAHREACRDYGKTFLGSIAKTLRLTKLSKNMTF